ncbi:MAG: flagellar hook-length control protein FliK [Lentisphaeria bacterium]|nr:flagellar hook-length control protein FliK [Lentisphaeria bacterium]NQZ66573.1 flagellar hook-length control protein FliK [Lentisphaeria bacterium]
MIDSEFSMPRSAMDINEQLTDKVSAKAKKEFFQLFKQQLDKHDKEPDTADKVAVPGISSEAKKESQSNRSESEMKTDAEKFPKSEDDQSKAAKETKASEETKASKSTTDGKATTDDKAVRSDKDVKTEKAKAGGKAVSAQKSAASVKKEGNAADSNWQEKQARIKNALAKKVHPPSQDLEAEKVKNVPKRHASNLDLADIQIKKVTSAASKEAAAPEALLERLDDKSKRKQPTISDKKKKDISTKVVNFSEARKKTNLKFSLDTVNRIPSDKLREKVSNHINKLEMPAMDQAEKILEKASATRIHQIQRSADIQQFAAELQRLIKAQPTNDVSLSLESKVFGNMNIIITESSGHLNLQFQMENDQARQQLQQQRAELVKLLKNMGYEGVEVSIENESNDAAESELDDEDSDQHTKFIDEDGIELSEI